MQMARLRLIALLTFGAMAAPAHAATITIVMEARAD
jgi:hypothetical protein